MERTLRLSFALGLCALLTTPHIAMAQDAAGAMEENVIVMREPKLAPYSVNQSTIFCGPYTWSVQWTTERLPLVVKGRVTVSAGDKVHEFDNAQADVFSKVQYMDGTTATCDFRDGMAYSQLLFGSDSDDGEGNGLTLSLPEGFAVAAASPTE